MNFDMLANEVYKADTTASLGPEGELWTAKTLNGQVYDMVKKMVLENQSMATVFYGEVAELAAEWGGPVVVSDGDGRLMLHDGKREVLKRNADGDFLYGDWTRTVDDLQGRYVEAQRDLHACLAGDPLVLYLGY